MRRLLPTFAACLVASCSAFRRPPLDRSIAFDCRSPDAATGSILWRTPDDAGERRRLDSWCAGVGRALFRSTATRPPAADLPSIEDIAFVSWNVHVGAGDVNRFVNDLRAGLFSDRRPITQFVLMLQEAVRRTNVPATLAPGARAARRIGRVTMSADDVDEIARKMNLSVLYVPSMRNGSPSDEEGRPSDRGNAILSTLPLTDARAIELPGTRQRRVAVEARIDVRMSGPEMSLIVGSAHLNVLGSARTAWVFGAASARAEQARTLIRTLPDGPIVLGADLNSWEGSEEPAIRALLAAFPSTPSKRQSTFRSGLDLDRLLFRLSDRWQAQVIRATDRYGADHNPVIGRIERR